MKRLIAAFTLCSLLMPWAYVPQVQAADVIDQREAELRAELERIEKEKAEIQKVLNETRTQTASIERDTAILTAEIRQAQLKIQELNVSIGNLGRDIDLKEKTVSELDEKIDNGKTGLAELIRTAAQVDDYTLPEILLANANLSDFFSQIDSYRTIQKSLNQLFGDIRYAIADTQEEKKNLSEKRERELDVKAEIEGQRRVIAAKEAEKKQLLAASKAEEQSYETVIADKERQAQAIRTALFQLRDAGGIEFGQAVEYAKAAAKATGVRPAFVLAILKQETDLGKNVGTCNRAGDPEEKSWRYIMPGPNDGDRSYRDDQTIFLEIMEELGRDPDTTPLSCPWGNGWGGAMGPSQFIPTTWKAYAPRIEAALGVAIADPWNPKHAFTATAIYVADLGATGKDYTSERTAALRYYAGSNWAAPQNAFYGNQVMAHAETFQANIELLDEVDN